MLYFPTLMKYILESYKRNCLVIDQLSKHISYSSSQSFLRLLFSISSAAIKSEKSWFNAWVDDNTRLDVIMVVWHMGKVIIILNSFFVSVFVVH